jgi:hypothetical protein
MLLLCTSIYLKSVLRYTFLILDTYRLREQGYEDPWLLLEAKRGPRAKNLGETLVQIRAGLPVRYSTSGAAYYRGADKSLARPGRKQAKATEDFDVHISYL